ncbi:MAG: restriction endonuclease subunit S [Sediminicola sp.]
MEKQSIPQLRFPEFCDEWKIKKIENILSIGSGKDYKHLQDGEIPVYGTGGYMTSVNEFLYDGESVCIGRKGTIDKPVFLNEKFWTVDTLFYTHSFKQVLPRFVYSLFQNINWYKHNEASGVPSLSKKTIEKINITIPQITEQQKIASFLSDVDQVITKLTKKKTLLEQYKKGIMQKIFNQELRFKDDNNNEFPDWQKNKLGKSVKFLKGKGLPKSEIVCDGQYKCIHYGELFTKYNELIDNIISRTNDNDKTILSKVNDVLMPTSDVTPNGLATASCIKESNVILGGDVLIIRQDIKKIEGVYLAYYIKHFRNDVMKLVSGSTVYHLYGSDMKNLQILIPCLDEQIKIANFLTDIDLKIAVLNTKIASNQNFKKGLLQKMFV